ncbi:MAG: L-rhamnose mutarotase [Bacteroidetes bacterium]|nr:L-rhamnose mutarotase [Bacteroidota bacterium]MBS1610463.1 L-rhamnose mutarotase [Bacteroidota bacterium]MBS1744796.1 L-rhamnose mutarotase [Bacteroidota bacterium]
MRKFFFFFIAVMLVTSSLFTACEQAPKAADEADKQADTTSVKTTANNVRRFGMVTGIKPDKIEYYKKLHANAWPQVQKMITTCNIQNYSIYLQKIDDKYYLFSYFEYTGNDFDADMKKMAADSTTQRWWKETDPTQIPLPEAAAKKETWTNMEEVFHQQ